MDIDSTEIQEWELLHPSTASDSELDVSSVLETEGLIQTNYFAIHSQTSPFSSENVSEESDNPSWVDPGTETMFPRENSGGFWSSSGSDDPQFEGENDVGVLENPIDEMVVENEVKFEEPDGITEVGFVQNSEMEDTGSENGKNHEEFWSDSGGVGLGDAEEVCVEEKERGEVAVSKAGKQKRSLVWWKVPLELLRYCVFRVRPMWAFSVAAAFMGFIILGRRLYKMKRKTKGLELKVTVDDKKVSQFMSRAARLNEAFSVVKRVPVIRPQLPAPGVSPWPVVSLR
ncbi:hypothetical protein RND71_039700 [Anisodus tanguticus]|uniref:DUF6821 domain-containing protein n=1 Tax=Anisodus tanguticus TaxID=243964 RepID=A0AAE1UXU6_9SOLA|nr:hypothetical protein RND71_039700 [Anisodus tanguticus]